MATTLRNTLADSVAPRLRPDQSAASDLEKRIAPTQRISQVDVCLHWHLRTVLTAYRFVAYLMTEMLMSSLKLL